MTTPPPSAAQLSAAAWRTSTYSAGNNECVEFAEISERACVRDSKDSSGPVLTFGPHAFASFIAHVKRTH
ncbi:DUF397 domain-containing protein [Streptomyces platensis]|uniref:DUF397 domain-containing protein n=1 Tax=Streptomyces platensis TaxID=58346 RepID=UPI00331A6CD8